MKGEQQFKENLTMMVSYKPKAVFKILKKELVDNGYMSLARLNDILTAFAYTFPMKDDAIMMYSVLYPYYSKVKDILPITEYFTEKEIRDAEKIKAKKRLSNFPLVFENVIQLDKSSYLLNLSIQDIVSLHNNGIIQIVPDMQRESVSFKYKDEIVSHVAYNDDVAREISKHILNGTYYSSTLRWHLVLSNAIQTEFGYDEENSRFFIQEGFIAEIDGQHRSAAMSYALLENPNIGQKFPIILSVGLPNIAQYIINQDEKRQPISKEHLKTFAYSKANSIVYQLSTDPSLLEYFSFVSTEDQAISKSNNINKNELAEVLDVIYKVEQNNPIENLEITNEIKTGLYYLSEVLKTNSDITQTNGWMYVYFIVVKTIINHFGKLNADTWNNIVASVFQNIKGISVLTDNKIKKCTAVVEKIVKQKEGEE